MFQRAVAFQVVFACRLHLATMRAFYRIDRSAHLVQVGHYFGGSSHAVAVLDGKKFCSAFATTDLPGPVSEATSIA